MGSANTGQMSPFLNPAFKFAVNEGPVLSGVSLRSLAKSIIPWTIHLSLLRKIENLLYTFMMAAVPSFEI